MLRNVDFWNLYSARFVFSPFSVQFTTGGGGTTGCNADQFTCDGGQCIPKDNECDNKDDCDNGEDENNCDGKL